MDFIITFFRDVLDGPLYIALVVFNSIMICSCIGYLGENYLNRKKAKDKYDSTYTKVSNETPVTPNTMQQSSQDNNNQV